MHFAINGMYLTNQAVGIANVIINVANQLSKSHDITIFANREILPEIKKRLEYSIKYIENKNPLLFRKPFWFFFKFSRLVNKGKYDYLWNPAVWTPFGIKKKTKKIVSVNDFVSRDYKNTMRFFNRIVGNMIEKYSIQNADYLWCISDYTKRRLEIYYPKRRCKKILIGCAPDPFIMKIQDNDLFNRTKKELNLPLNYMLFVGSLEPRKNLRFLLQVFKEYSTKNLNLSLVIVGASGWGKTYVEEIIHSEGYPIDRVLFTGFVSEEQLRVLYNLASIYISTSLNEGFGLPQVEAMNCEVPVISPHNSAMIEVVEGAGITVEDWKMENWSTAIDMAIQDRDAIISKQNERKKIYQWETIIPHFYEYLGI